MSFVPEVLAHAEQEMPREACGLVVMTARGRHRVIRAKNLAPVPERDFHLDPDAWLEVEEGEAVIGIYHSHTKGSPEPSMADRVSCEASELPWHIVSVPGGEYRYLEPTGFKAPYERRPYVLGVLDCYSVIRDWYSREWGIQLPDFDRKPFLAGENLYERHYANVGFERVHDEPQQIGDVLLFGFGRTRLPHAAVCLGRGRILHHPQDRLSLVESVDGMWNRHVTHHLRHHTRINHG
jgi:proteasome lid subunit RPN8/RPN11